MADDDQKPNYTKPTSQLDLEARQSEDYVPAGQVGMGEDPKPSDTGFVNVDPIYQNFANDTERPYKAEDGPEKVAEEVVYADDADFDAGKAEDGGTGEEDEDDEESTQPTGSGATTSGSTSPTGSTIGSSSPTTPPSSGSNS